VCCDAPPNSSSLIWSPWYLLKNTCCEICPSSWNFLQLMLLLHSYIQICFSAPCLKHLKSIQKNILECLAVSIWNSYWCGWSLKNTSLHLLSMQVSDLISSICIFQHEALMKILLCL
jgi:hypothetical protein